MKLNDILDANTVVLKNKLIECMNTWNIERQQLTLEWCLDEYRKHFSLPREPHLKTIINIRDNFITLGDENFWNILINRVDEYAFGRTAYNAFVIINVEKSPDESDA